MSPRTRAKKRSNDTSLEKLPKKKTKEPSPDEVPMNVPAVESDETRSPVSSERPTVPPKQQDGDYPAAANGSHVTDVDNSSSNGSASNIIPTPPKMTVDTSASPEAASSQQVSPPPVTPATTTTTLSPVTPLADTPQSAGRSSSPKTKPTTPCMELDLQLREMSGSAVDETSNNVPVLTTMWQAYTGSSSSSPVAQIRKALDKAVQEKNKLSSMLQATGPALDEMRGQLLEVERERQRQVQAVTQERDELEAALHKERVQHNKWKSETMTMTTDRNKFRDKLRQAERERQEAAAVHETQMQEAQQLIAEKTLQTEQLQAEGENLRLEIMDLLKQKAMLVQEFEAS